MSGRSEEGGVKLRIVHYVNQFFGGIGGEEAAGSPLKEMAGAVGPGRLQSIANLDDSVKLGHSQQISDNRSSLR